MKSNFVRPEHTKIHVNPDGVYQKVEELRNILRGEILPLAEKRCREGQETLSEMSGKSVSNLGISAEMSRQKTIGIATVLEKTLSFIESTTREFVEKDKGIGQKILRSEQTLRGGQK